MTGSTSAAVRADADTALLRKIADVIIVGYAAAMLLAATLAAFGQFIIPIFEPPVSTVTTFTPLHLFFLSTTGSDANDGLSPTVGGGHGPWASPNHALSCGDVIIAAAGDYSAVNMGSWGTVSNCPSTTGGIDGTGGIYFAVLLCGGADLEACHTSGQLWNIPKNNWAIEGFKITNGCTSTPSTCGSPQRAINFNGCSAVVHHLAAINNIMYGVSSAVHTDDCGNVGAGFGVDYTAYVGNIGAQASMNKSFPEAAFDSVGTAAIDTNAGTHHYIYNNYTWNDNASGTSVLSQNTCIAMSVPCGVPFDSESFMFDSWDAHPGNNNTGVLSNNISWSAQRFCIQFINSSHDIITPTFKVYNNTCFRDNLNTWNPQANGNNGASDFADAEINLAVGLPTWVYTIKNNIVYQPLATSPSGGGDIYAVNTGGGGINTVTWSGNVFTGSDTSCVGTCDAPTGGKFNVIAFDLNSIPTGILGVNPGFNNTSDLLTNRSGNTPNCSGFINTTACMGWNANTAVLTNPSVIYDLQPDPNCGSVGGQCVGKGFQLPSTTCASSGDVFTDYPVWLKGIVYLHASGFTSGATITQQHDLATTRCGF